LIFFVILVFYVTTSGFNYLLYPAFYNHVTPSGFTGRTRRKHKRATGRVYTDNAKQIYHSTIQQIKYGRIAIRPNKSTIKQINE